MKQDTLDKLEVWVMEVTQALHGLCREGNMPFEAEALVKCNRELLDALSREDIDN